MLESLFDDALNNICQPSNLSKIIRVMFVFMYIHVYATIMSLQGINPAKARQARLAAKEIRARRLRRHLDGGGRCSGGRLRIETSTTYYVNACLIHPRWSQTFSLSLVACGWRLIQMVFVRLP